MLVKPNRRAGIGEASPTNEPLTRGLESLPGTLSSAPAGELRANAPDRHSLQSGSDGRCCTSGAGPGPDCRDQHHAERKRDRGHADCCRSRCVRERQRAAEFSVTERGSIIHEEDATPLAIRTPASPATVAAPVCSTFQTGHHWNQKPFSTSHGRCAARAAWRGRRASHVPPLTREKHQSNSAHFQNPVPA